MNLAPKVLRRSLECWARWRLGWPAPGRVVFHAHGGYTFEQGADLGGRLAARFGALEQLECLDLGSGPGESVIARQLLAIPWRRLIQVEDYPPYLEQLRAREAAAREREIRAERIEAAVAGLGRGAVDVALLIDVLEHFSRRDALRLLVRLERVARRGVVVFVPLGEVEQDELDGNPLQRHRSEWYPSQLARLGYEVEVYENFHGQLAPPASAAWAIRRR